jgi:mortality factor 4-like protein 1
LKLNEENVALQKGLQAQASAASASAASSSKHKSGGGHKDGSASRVGASARKDGGRGTKRGREEVSVLLDAAIGLLIVVSAG